MNKSSTFNFLMGKSASNKSFILRRVSACTDSEMDRAEMLAALNSHFQFKKGFDSELAEHYDENVCLDRSKELDCEAPNDNFQNNCRHICKYCQREFSSGRALGGHMRAHTSLQSHVNPWNCSLDDVADKQLQVSSSCGQSSNLHSGCEMKYGSSSHQADRSLSSSFYDQLSKRDKFLSTRSGANIDKERSYAMDTEDESSVIKAPSQSLEMNNSEMEGGAADGFVHASNYHDNIFENDEMFVKNKRFPPLYTLRRNPKPSKRLVEVVASGSASDSMRILSLRDGDVHACTECGKQFGSWKGLFGHMRCHPEREWRGIHRRIAVQPNHEEKEITYAQTSSCAVKGKFPLFDSNVQRKQQSASEFATSIAHSLSDTESETDSIEAAYMKCKIEYNLQRWKTRKRSTFSRQMIRSLQMGKNEAAELGRSNRHNVSTDVKEEMDMADCLVMLACGKLSQSELSHAKISKIVASDGSSDVKRRIAEESVTTVDATRFNNWIDYPQDRTISIREMKTKRRFLNEEIMKREESHEADEPDANDQEAKATKYECTRCKKTFKSHQALGGHRASHKKVKGCCARAYSGTKAHHDQSLEDELSLDEDLPRSFEEENYANHYEDEIKSLHFSRIKPTMRQIKKTNAHKCSICHRVFASGQALGGHKRRHWGGVGSSEPDNCIIKHEGRTSLRQTFQSRKMREDIDLNLPAPLEDAGMICFETAPINNEN